MIALTGRRSLLCAVPMTGIGIDMEQRVLIYRRAAELLRGSTPRPVMVAVLVPVVR
jgi:hypothetical protein